MRAVACHICRRSEKEPLRYSVACVTDAVLCALRCSALTGGEPATSALMLALPQGIRPRPSTVASSSAQA